jgi:hypothetical protein
VKPKALSDCVARGDAEFVRRPLAIFHFKRGIEAGMNEGDGQADECNIVDYVLKGCDHSTKLQHKTLYVNVKSNVGATSIYG